MYKRKSDHELPTHHPSPSWASLSSLLLSLSAMLCPLELPSPPVSLYRGAPKFVLLCQGGHGVSLFLFCRHGRRAPASLPPSGGDQQARGGAEGALYHEINLLHGEIATLKQELRKKSSMEADLQKLKEQVAVLLQNRLNK